MPYRTVLPTVRQEGRDLVTNKTMQQKCEGFSFKYAHFHD